jgi:uncharacterized membrane protein YccC
MSDLPRLQVDNGVAWRSLVCFQHRHNVRRYEGGIGHSKRFSPWHPRCHTPVGPVVAQMEIRQLRKLIIARENPSSLTHAARTAVATIVSYLVANSFRLPEAYWAPLSTLIVIESTLGSALPISVQSFAGTAIGAAAAGAAIASYFHGSLWAFGIAVFLIGILCAVVLIERSVYRCASITVAIVLCFMA